jgi:uncharacterized membrane protein
VSTRDSLPTEPSTERLEAFSDGVLAIAITLLILDLRVPVGVRDGGLAHALVSRELFAQYAAYVVSFLVIGITWMNHHTLFRLIARADRALLVLNLLLLLLLSFLPFPTRVLASYISGHGSTNAHAAAFLYSLTMFYVGGMFAAVWWYASGHGGRLLREPMARREVMRSRLRFGAGMLGYLATLGLSFVSAPLVLAIHGLLACYYAFEQLDGRRPA